MASESCSFVVMTKGPYCSTGSPMGSPAIMMNFPLFPLKECVFTPLESLPQQSVLIKCSFYSSLQVSYPSQTNTIEFQVVGISSQKWSGSLKCTSKQQAGVQTLIGPFTPSHSPAMTFTDLFPFLTIGISAALSSWYLGSIILFWDFRFSQSWKPFEVTSKEVGIYEWTIPFPAVIHWISPGPITPLCPLKSSWVNSPSSMQVTVSNPR